MSDSTLFLISLGCFLLAYALLWLVQLPCDWRHGQRASPLFALTLFAGYLAFLLGYAPLLALVAALDRDLLRPVLAHAGLSPLPLDLLIATALLLVFLSLKLLLLLVVLGGGSLRWFFHRLRHGFAAAKRTAFASLLPPAPAYDSEASGQTLLKPGWIWLRRSAGATGAALLAALVALQLADNRFPSMFPSDWPIGQWFLAGALLALVLLEVAWYLGGRDDVRGAGELTASAADSSLPLNHLLLETYRALWPDCLLAWSAGRPAGSPRTGAAIGASSPSSTEGADALRAVSGDGRRSAPEDMLLPGLDAEAGAAVLFPELSAHLARGERVLLLVDAGQACGRQLAAELQAWLCRGFGLASPEQALWQWHLGPGVPPASASLWIVGVDALAEGLIGGAARPWLAGVGLALFFDSEGFSGSLARRYALAQALRELSARRVVLAPGSRNFDSAYRENVKLAANTLTGPRQRRPVADCSTLLWRTEAVPAFERRVLQGAPSGAIGAELALALVALDGESSGVRRARTVILTERSRAPDRDFLVNLAAARAASAANPVDAEGLEAITVALSWSLAKRPQGAVIIAADQAQNVPDLLARLNAKASPDALLHVLCPPYLLREYFIAHLDFFLRQPLKPLEPVVTDAPDAVAERLLYQLLVTGLGESELRDQLRDAQVDFHQASIGVFRLLRDQFGIDILREGYLETQDERIRLSPRVLDHPHLAALRPCRLLVTDSAETLAVLPREHVTQHYLPGQCHAINGRLFRVEQINEDSVQLEHQAPTQAIYAYRAELEVRLSARALERSRHRDDIRQTRRADGVLGLRRSLCRVPAAVDVRGWYEFHAGQPGRYRPLSPGLRRAYRPARALWLEFSCSARPETAPDSPATRPAPTWARNSALTWAVLLRELLPSLLPRRSEYCIVLPLCTLEPDPAEPSHLAVPKVIWETPPEARPHATEQDVGVLILEDSHSDLGLAQVLYDEVDAILRILHDYLTWLLAAEPSTADACGDWRRGSSSPPPYLAYGQSEISPNLALSAVLSFLDQWHSDGNALRGARLAWQEASGKGPRNHGHEAFQRS